MSDLTRPLRVYFVSVCFSGKNLFTNRTSTKRTNLRSIRDVCPNHNVVELRETTTEHGSPESRDGSWTTTRPGAVSPVLPPSVCPDGTGRVETNVLIEDKKVNHKTASHLRSRNHRESFRLRRVDRLVYGEIFLHEG